MTTYLLAWNPAKWPWGDLNRELASVRDKIKTTNRWSCGNVKNIEIGSRFFLIRLGLAPKGIVASGRILSKPFSASHWHKLRADRGEQAKFVEIEFDALFRLPRLTLEELQVPPLGPFHWGTQMSGIRIPEELAIEVEKLWQQRTGTGDALIPEEVKANTSYREGSARRILVNAYERDPAARNACIKHHGFKCVACGFSFEEYYGEIGKDFIHVHHMVPLSRVGADYEVNPIEDMRPVCPNCHAVIHRREPPYTPAEVSELIRKSRSG